MKNIELELYNAIDGKWGLEYRMDEALFYNKVILEPYKNTMNPILQLMHEDEDLIYIFTSKMLET